MNKFATLSSRNSNIELLRFLLMLAICIWHTYVHGFGYVEILTYSDSDISIPVYRLLIMCFLVPAVNCFMYISGYYGIKLTRDKFLRFWVLGVSIIIGCSFVFNVSHAVAYVFPMSSGVWWFMKCYLFIMLISPFIEKGVAYMSNVTIVKVLFVLLLMNSVIKMLNFQGGGSDVVSLLNIYLIGRFFHKNKTVFSLKVSLLIWSMATFMLFSLILYINSYGNRINIWLLLGYNNPLIIIQTIAIVSVFLRLRPRYNSFLNVLGRNSLSIYLITELLGVSFMYRWWAGLLDESLLMFAFVILLTALLCVVFSELVSMLTTTLLNKLECPIKVVDRYVEFLMNKISKSK